MFVTSSVSPRPPVPQVDLPSAGNLVLAAWNPPLAAMNDFSRSVARDPQVLTNPIAFTHAYSHACMVGWASAFWTFSALTQPVGVTAGLIPRRRAD